MVKLTIATSFLLNYYFLGSFCLLCFFLLLFFIIARLQYLQAAILHKMSMSGESSNSNAQFLALLDTVEFEQNLFIDSNKRTVSNWIN